jgi:hypothetical protein
MSVATRIEDCCRRELLQYSIFHEIRFSAYIDSQSAVLTTQPGITENQDNTYLKHIDSHSYRGYTRSVVPEQSAI